MVAATVASLAAGLVGGSSLLRQLRRPQRSSGLTMARASGADFSDGDGDGSEGVARSDDLVFGRRSADIMRRDLWDMPKDVLRSIQPHKVRFRTKDKQWTRRELVVVKGASSSEMVERAQKVISDATLTQSKLLHWSRVGRENFGRDVIREQSRGGRRAFRYRSGMRDLRNEKGFRWEEKRLPDHKRKRSRPGAYRKRISRWTGVGKKKYKRT